MEGTMFCHQCQETAHNTGCTVHGVCGKSDEVANLQDVLLFAIEGISIFSSLAREMGVDVPEVNRFILESLFSTITNANFDRSVFIARVKKAIALREDMKAKLTAAGGTLPAALPDCATWTPHNDSDIEKKGTVGWLAIDNEDIRALKATIVFGIKGIAAYTDHAQNLNQDDIGIHAFVQRALARITADEIDIEELVALVLETGKYGVDAMAVLDKSNTTAYGNPEITSVNIGVRNNPGILISGHDLRDLHDLLEQTIGTGVDIYTHAEMLPSHYYPFFKKYDHLAGNYGNAWWMPDNEFMTFNGPILFTSNCITPVAPQYADHVYTTGACGYPGCKHIADRAPGQMKDFSEIIAQAKTSAPPQEIETGTIVGGFAHVQTLALLDKIIDAVKTGAIKKFFVMAGCDGQMKSREYYTEFAKALPHDAVILTAGCAKYRYNKLGLGDIDGIPRVLDAGQCNDCYSLAVIALKLKEALGLDDVNKLPIIFNISWYEQKAVTVLLALLHLGFKNIHLGPTLPGFLSANVVKILVDNFGIGGITNVDDDVKMFMGL